MGFKKVLEDMRNKRRLLSSAILLATLAIMLVIESVAWLAMNVDTSSNNMEFNVEVSPNLIIANDANKAAFLDTDNPVGFLSVTFSDSTTSVIPTAHDGEKDALTWTYSTGLKYLTDTSSVKVATGTVEDSSALVFSEAILSQDKVYYKDYKVYIASTVEPVTNVCITATLESVNTITLDTHYALSVDFYVGGTSMTAPSREYYAGSANLSYAKIGGSPTSVDLKTNAFSSNDNYDIPHNKADSDNYITVIMRCYFDDALTYVDENSIERAYINSATINTTGLSFKISFEAN